MTTWTDFAASGFINPTGPNLADNFTSVFNTQASFICGLAGTNDITASVTTGTPAITALTNGMTFLGIAVNTNTTATTFAPGSFSPLPVYADTPAGPVALSGGEIVQDCACWFSYRSLLNSGNGGYLLRTGGAILKHQTVTMAGLILGTSPSILKRQLSGLYTVSFGNTAAQTTSEATVALAGCSVNDNVLLGLPASLAAGVVYNGYVSVAGTVVLRAANITAASLTPTGGTCRVTALGWT